MKTRGLVESFHAVEIPVTEGAVAAEKIYVQGAGFTERYSKRPCTPKGDYAMTLREGVSGELSVMFESIAASATHYDVMDVWALEKPRRRSAFKDAAHPDFQSYLNGLETLMSASAPALREDVRQQGLDAPVKRF